MIAIIPARGGSKGLPGKNLRPFGGKPLIAVSVELANACQYIDHVIVSTDDLDIAKAAKEYGAEVPFMRPEELASDTSPAIDTYLYTLKRLNDEGYCNDNDFIVLLPTAPLRTLDHLNESIELYYEKKADSVISVTESLIPIEWTRVVDEDGRLREYFKDGNKNRQEYRTTHIPNGQIYIFNYLRLKETRQYYMSDTYAYETEKKYYGDIDDLDDFRLTEFKYRMLNE